MEALDARRARCVQQRLRPEDVRAEEPGRVDDGERVVGLGREVHDDLGAVLPKRRLGELPIADVPLDERDPALDRRKVLAIPGVREQVVDHDLVAGVPLDPVVDEVGADEPGAAGDE